MQLHNHHLPLHAATQQPSTTTCSYTTTIYHYMQLHNNHLPLHATTQQPSTTTCSYTTTIYHYMQLYNNYPPLRATTRNYTTTRPTDTSTTSVPPISSCGSMSKLTCLPHATSCASLRISAKLSSEEEEEVKL